MTTRLVALVLLSVGTRVGATCPPPSTPQAYVFQTDAAAAEIVVADGTLAGADHWEVSRLHSGTTAPVALVPAAVPASVSSLVDRGQGLVAGETYTYTVTVQQQDGSRASYVATAVDAGSTPVRTLGTTLTLSTAFGFDQNGQRVVWGAFPAPIGRLYAKHAGIARVVATNAALPCASITVTDAGTGALVPLFADRWGHFAQPNPVTADAHGAFEFHADNGTYDIAVAGGSSSYTLSRVDVYDARAARTSRSKTAAALTTVSSDAPASGDANIPLAITRPNSTDPNDGPLPYRVLANEARNAWAVTYNLRSDEATDTVQFDDANRSGFRIRVDRASQALEFALDPGCGVAVPSCPFLGRSPSLETLLHFGTDRSQLKAVMSPVGIQAVAAEAGIHSGDVVAMQSDGRVVHTTQARQPSAFAVLAVDAPNDVSSVGSTVYLGVTGRAVVHVRGAVSEGDALVSTSDGVATASPDETNPLYIVGYSRRQAGTAGSVNFIETDFR